MSTLIQPLAKQTRNHKKILLLGSGALKIGEAGEFDYSGSQAIKALKEEGLKVIVINPNIATYQTSQGLADKIYFLPVNPYFVGKVIEQEKPDGILLSFGGQTALNCGLELSRLNKLKPPLVLGTPIEAIQKTEDRDLFVKTLQEIKLLTPRSQAVKSVAAALKAAQQIGYPVIIRSAFSLGGQGSAFAKNKKELQALATEALAQSPQILLEEDLTGWKEIEYEVVRDAADNCITVCNMENMDPMGVHTGESIVVAPSQTLTNEEYHELRQISIKLIKHLKILGECNIQFALRVQSQKSKLQLKAIKNNNSQLNNSSIDYRIIEVNARLSRSSALASKATGYPLAFIAAKLALGWTLPELKNSVTQSTTAFFEPALDYVVVKMPRWDLDKFRQVERTIGPQMKSVGEVMAIGRNFEEAIQKASRMLGLDQNGLIASYQRLKQKYPTSLPEFNNNKKSTKFSDKLVELIKIPNEHRLLAIAEGLKRGLTAQKISDLSKIDLWFISKIKNIIDLMDKISKLKNLDVETTRQAKNKGFSDKQIAVLRSKQEKDIFRFRKKNQINPQVNQIDTLAAEYPAKTNYLYLTYQPIQPAQTTNYLPQTANSPQNAKKKIIILGSGVYRIGSSVEFDWCAVTCAQTLKKAGYQVIMINHNPETVSTDYDMADKLYFEELNYETVREIYDLEKPDGLIMSMGGQTPNNIALRCHQAGLKILGTSALNIDRAENRYKFSKLLARFKIDQPKWQELTSIEEAKAFAQKVGYPVLIRPSYVLSGAAMNVAIDNQTLKEYLGDAAQVSKEHPVVISKFIQNAKEIEVDAVAKKGRLIAYIISEHIENAGVHSGDATIVTPPQKIYLETYRKIRIITNKIAQALKISGPFNIQFLARENRIKVIECNLRASRSFPFVSKVSGVNLIEIATKVILNQKVDSDKIKRRLKNFMTTAEYIGVKAPQFSFSRIKGADPILRVEMASTGEVGCLGQNIEEAFLKSILSTGFAWPKKAVLISLGGDVNKAKFLASAKRLFQHTKLKIFATKNTAKFLRQNGIKCQTLYKIYEKKEPNIKTYLANKKIDLVINMSDAIEKRKIYDENTIRQTIRRTAADFAVPIITNLQIARLFVTAICKYRQKDLQIDDWQKYLQPIATAKQIRGFCRVTI